MIGGGSPPLHRGEPNRRDRPRVSAAVLAGGSSTRMGYHKGLFEVDGRPLISRVTDALVGVSDDLLCVTCEPTPYQFESHRLRFTPDEGELSRGPLSGIAGALAAARHEWCVVAAVDMPLLKTEVLERLIQWAHGDADVVVPIIESDRPEALHAVYRKSCLAPARAALAAGQRKVASFFGEVRVVRVAREELCDIEGYLESFININTRAALEQVRKDEH
jgi:molybdopterin-guanine dinucleotide biosynthesis protein A